MSDLVVLVDGDDNIIGEAPRKEAHEKGLLHRTAYVLVVRPDGDVLVQQRLSGRLDVSAGGHVDPGETYEAAALRELEEELGITGVELEKFGVAELKDERPDIGISVHHKYRLFSCIAEPKRVEKKEIERVCWANPDEVLKDMEQQKDDKKYSSGFEDVLRMFGAHTRS